MIYKGFQRKELDSKTGEKIDIYETPLVRSAMKDEDPETERKIKYFAEEKFTYYMMPAINKELMYEFED